MNQISFINWLNVEIGDVVIKDVAEKIGSLFGEGGRLVGRIIDELTEDITIKIDGEKSDK